MTNNDIMTILGFFGALVALVAPILKLNTSIVRLNANFENMIKNDEVRDQRISTHGKEIDDLRDSIKENSHTISNHETRIQSLERKRSA